MINKQDSNENNKQDFTDYLIGKIPFLNLLFKKLPWLPQFINFGIVGFSNMVVAYIVYALLVMIYLHPQVANAISFAASVANAYLWNKVWVFKKQNNKPKLAPIKFITVYGANYLFGVFLLFLYTDVLHWSPYIAPLISLPITIPINFLMNKFWVFKKN